MSDPILRRLTFGDLDEALSLSTTAGWNQQRDDWRMLLQLAPAGAFAALSEARIVGTAIGIDYGGFAWIAMMLVDPAYRGRGVGRCLLEAAMDAVPSNLPIRLDATPLGRPLYQRHGFEDEAMLSRYVADGSTHRVASASEALDRSRDVRPLTASDLDIVIDRDSETFGGTRGAVLNWAFRRAAQYAHVVAREADEWRVRAIRTFGLTRLGVHMLFPEPLEPVRQFRASFSLVRELADEQREWFGITGDP